MRKILISLAVMLVMTMLQSICYSELQVDLKKQMGIKYVDPFISDKLDFTPSDIRDGDKLQFAAFDFLIKGKGRGADLDLCFVRYYNNKLNNNGVCGYSCFTNLDVSFQMVSGLYVVKDEKGEEFSFNSSYNYYLGMVYVAVSMPNPHSFYSSNDYWVFKKKYGNKYFLEKLPVCLKKFRIGTTMK